MSFFTLSLVTRHSKNWFDQKLKGWLIPFFKNRIDWDIHKLSACHLVALDKEPEKNVDEKEYYEGNFADKVLDLVTNKDGASGEATKEDDPLKEEKITEAAQLTLAKVLLYKTPDFEDSEVVGESIHIINTKFCSQYVNWHIL